MLCNYGCNKEATYQLKNKKWCCENSTNKCSEVRRKNSESVIKARKLKGWINFQPHNIKKECIYCNEKISIAGHKLHMRSCYLNPLNKKECPVCNKIIKNYNNNTCSKSCAKILSNQGINHPRWKDDSKSYISTCKEYHGLTCIICGEDKVFNVHHIDKNRNNNFPENLIPLCPTHHSYIHKGFSYLIQDKIDEFINNFTKN